MTIKDKRSDDHELLRRTIREYLHTIKRVPMRAVDCDQTKEDRLWRKLKKLSGYRL